MKKIRTNKELINKLKPYYEKYKEISNEYCNRIYDLEKQMSREFQIKEMEFFHCDGDFAGIGNSERTMKLIQRQELEK